MANNNTDLELLDRLEKGGDITQADTRGTNQSDALISLTEGTTSLSYELGSKDKGEK